MLMGDIYAEELQGFLYEVHLLWDVVVSETSGTSSVVSDAISLIHNSSIVSAFATPLLVLSSSSVAQASLSMYLFPNIMPEFQSMGGTDESLLYQSNFKDVDTLLLDYPELYMQ